MKDFNEYKELKEKQDKIVSELSIKLNSFPKNEFGMVVENIRMSDDFNSIKKSFTIEYKKLQDINKLGSKLFKKEIKNEQSEKRKLWRK